MAQIGLGIYLDGNKISIAAIKRSVRQMGEKGCETTILQKPDLADDAAFTEISDIIQNFCKSRKIKPAYISMGISGNDHLWSIIDMPPVSRNDVKQILNYELELYVPFDPESYFFDALPLPSSASLDQSPVLLVCAPQSRINALLETTRRCGLSLDSVEPASMALWRLLRETKGKENLPDSSIMLSFGEKNIELMLLDKGFPTVNRVIGTVDPWGRSSSMTNTLEDTQTGLRNPAEDIVSALKFSNLSIGKSGNLEEYSHAIVLGTPPESALAYLDQMFPHIVFQTLDAPEIIPSHASLNELIAMGSAMSGEEDEEISINLVPQEIRPFHRRTGLMVTGIMSGFLVSAMLLMGANTYWATDLQLAKAQARIAGLSDRVNRITEINTEHREALTIRDLLKEFTRDYPTELQILRELTSILPSDDEGELKKVWLESYQRKDIEITIRGQSESPEELITVLEESQLFEKVHVDGAVTGTKFTIKANLSKIQVIDDDTHFDESGEKEPGEGNGVGATAVSTPPAADDDDEAKPPDNVLPDEEEEEILPRGPAFPRQQREAPEENIPEAPMHEEPAESESESKDDADIEQMKENLFDFIRQHKEEGNVVDRDRGTYEEPDPDEAAENFLEFLKTAAEEREPSQEYEE